MHSILIKGAYARKEINMETTKAKLMKPLFYGMNFNRDEKKMRAIFEKEVTNGINTYRLWKKAGKPDHDYPNAENDNYLLYVEAGDYLAPLGMTEYSLVNHCGYDPAINKLYGGKEGRSQHYQRLRECGNDDDCIASVRKEQETIIQCGSNSSLQADYIQAILNGHIKTYIESKECGGKSFPDFVGAAMMGELDTCKELSQHYKEIRESERKSHIAAVREKERKEIREKNGIANDKVQQAIQIIRSRGTVKNDEVTFFDDLGIGKTYHMINYLMQRYGIEVPLRTQGWINAKLAEITVQDGGCSLRFYKSKNCKCSQKFFTYMNLLIGKIQNGVE